jgi:hypothetical protein
MPNLPTFSELVAAGPVSLALIAFIAACVVAYKLGPKWIEQRKARADESTETRLRRAEDHIRDLRGWYLDMRDSHEALRVRVEEVAGDVRETGEAVRGTRDKLEDLCERIDRQDAAMGGRMDRIEGGQSDG